MTPEEIKHLLKLKRITQGDLCRKWNLPRTTLSHLVNRHFKSDRLEKRLARTLGVSLEVLRKSQRDE